RSEIEEITRRQTDVVTLNRAAVTLFSEILHHGMLIYSADDALRERLAAAVDDVAEDFRDFITDFGKIKERSRSLSPNDKVRLLRIIDFINDQLPDFERFAGLGQREYEQNKDIRRNVERWAETLANASIDAAKIIIASRKHPMPPT